MDDNKDLQADQGVAPASEADTAQDSDGSDTDTEDTGAANAVDQNQDSAESGDESQDTGVANESTDGAAENTEDLG